MYTHILVPTDGSPLSGNAIQQAVSLAGKLGAKITALHVVDSFPPAPGGEGSFAIGAFSSNMMHIEYAETERAKAILAAVKEAARKAGIECDTVTAAGTPYEAIIKQAGKSKCDLIVMASHGRRGLRALLLGSETIRVLTHSAIPVLVCR